MITGLFLIFEIGDFKGVETFRKEPIPTTVSVIPYEGANCKSDDDRCNLLLVCELSLKNLVRYLSQKYPYKTAYLPQKKGAINEAPKQD